MAALHVNRMEYDAAFRMYKSVLRWADDYKGAMSVDSLMRIHSFHNMLEANAMNRDAGQDTSAEEVSASEELCAKIV